MAQNPAAAANNHGEGLRQPETSSRCVTDGATHNFEITNWTLLEDMGAGNRVTSSKFSAGGYDWNIRFYPDGGDHRKDSAGYGSAFLSCLSLQDKESVRAKYSLTMLDDKGKIHVTYEAKRVIFAPETATWGFTKFIEKSKLKESHHLDTGLLTIRCVLVVIKEPPTECNINSIVVPTQELSGQLERALENGRGADVTLLVGGREFRAHSFILAARSPVFDAQLFGPMTMDKDTTRAIEVDDMEPAILEMLLQFIYTDSLPSSNDKEDYDVATMQHLLVAADRYGLDSLKSMCEIKLCNSIDIHTVKSTLALASQHYCEGLKNACLEFMSKPGVAAIVFLTDGIKGLMARPTPLVLEENPGDKAVPNV